MKRDLSDYKSNLKFQLYLNLILFVVLSIITVFDIVYKNVLFSVIGIMLVSYNLYSLYVIVKMLLEIKKYEQE